MTPCLSALVEGQQVGANEKSLRLRRVGAVSVRSCNPQHQIFSAVPQVWVLLRQCVHSAMPDDRATAGSETED